jgi:hypothetical protein
LRARDEERNKEGSACRVFGRSLSPRTRCSPF